MNRSSWKSLHIITQIIVLAAVARLVADTVVLVQDVKGLMDLGPYATQAVKSPLIVLATTAHAYAYSLLFFGSAATVELLYRIWRELRQLRLSGVTVEPSGPPTSA